MNKRFSIGLILIVSVCFALCGFFIGCDGEPAPREITGVNVIGAEVRYDGAEHSVTVSGVLDGDEVYYAETESGQWSERKPAYVVPGQYTVYCKVVRVGFDDFISSATVTISRGILSGISAADKTYIYDGKPHGIDIYGVLDTDSVLYSLDGENFSAELAIVEPGEYTVFYRVTSAYSDYADSCGVTVLPNISGTYVNPDRGVAVLTATSANIGGEEFPLSYGAAGSGVIGEREFAVGNGILTYGDAEYRLLGADEFVYLLAAGGAAVYVVSGDTAEFDVEFTDGGASITLNGDEVLSVPNVNYCERVSGGEVRRTYETTDVAVAVAAAGRINAVDIELSLRKRLEFCYTPQTVVYDGEAHELNVEFDGRVLYADGDGYTETPPSYTEAGSYSAELLLLPDEFLPERVTVSFTVIPNISGVYYSEAANAVIEIDGTRAELCGAACELAYSDGALTLDGKVVAVTESGIAVGGTEYIGLRRGDRLTLVDIDGRFMLFLNVADVVFSTDGGALTVLVNDETEFTVPLDADTVRLRITVGAEVAELAASGGRVIIGKTELGDGEVVHVKVRAE